MDIPGGAVPDLAVAHSRAGHGFHLVAGLQVGEDALDARDEISARGVDAALDLGKGDGLADVVGQDIEYRLPVLLRVRRVRLSWCRPVNQRRQEDGPRFPPD